MLIDLSTANENGLALILLRVPGKELLKTCTLVSSKWKKILSQSFFWRDKMDYDGCGLDWTKLVGISAESLKRIAVKHCFDRNFIKDEWNLELQNAQSLALDPRWRCYADEPIVWQGEEIVDEGVLAPARIEIPPAFFGQPEIPTGFETIPACICIHHNNDDAFVKGIVIKLADEGLTDDIMDNFRPTIVVSEMVANRFDSVSTFRMVCFLGGDIVDEGFFPHGIHKEKETREELRDDNGRWIAKSFTKTFNHFGQIEVERWHQVEHQFKDYPKGMRYLKLSCVTIGFCQYAAAQYGLKMANCSVKALFEKNATE